MLTLHIVTEAVSHYVVAEDFSSREIGPATNGPSLARPGHLAGDEVIDLWVGRLAASVNVLWKTATLI